MRANLRGSFVSFDEEWFEGNSKPKIFKKLVFGICFFHACVIERKKFGPLGWNIPYTFSTPDLRITLDQINLFLNQYEEVPWKMIRYLTSQCNYGGRVTDDKDRRLITNMITDFCDPAVLDDSYRYSTRSEYYCPPEGPAESYLDYISTLPFETSPELFEMHDNANITSAISETMALLNTALALQPKTSGGDGVSWEDQLKTLASDIENRLPSLFDIEKARVLYPVKFEESMNTVLTEELLKFNRLLDRMSKSLSQVQKAIVGLVVMSQELENMGNAMVKGWVPVLWSSVAYPSLKPLGSWVNDLVDRTMFFNNWLANDRPVVNWISGFFFTPSFLTGTLQNYARKMTIAIDELAFEFQVLSPEEIASLDSRPSDGAYIRGLFLQGAAWNADDGCLVDSRPKELFSEVPVIWLKPHIANDIVQGHRYVTPVYKTSERQGMLSTTGHSTNFVLYILLPMLAEHQEKHHIKGGVAMLTQLDD